MSEDYLSVKDEPAFQNGGFKADSSEREVIDDDLDLGVGGQTEIERIRDSVHNEPGMGEADNSRFREWLASKRESIPWWSTLGITVLAGLLGGPFAVIGALFADKPSVFGAIYAILFAPVIEEVLKQSGMIYLLESKPYRISGAWQFVVAALISSLIFASIENLIYINIYTVGARLKDPEFFAMFRWTVCTALHVTCSLIAAFGLVRVWKKQLADGKPVSLQNGYRYFATAMTLHGVYNFIALFFLQNLFT